MGAGSGGNFGNTKGGRSNAQIHQGRQDKHIKVEMSIKVQSKFTPNF